MSLLIRTVRLVPVGGRPAPVEPVDLRIRHGVVEAVAPCLAPAAGERVVEADGRWAIPGLWDQHVHMAQWAQTSMRLDVRGAGGPDEAAELVAAHVAGLPAGSVVLGFGYRLAAWDRTPTVAELDAVSGDHPVVLISGDVHNGWLNSRALALLGLAPRTGVIEEGEWFAVFERLGDLPGVAEATEAAVRAAVGDAARRGVVGIVDMEFARGWVDWPARVAAGVDGLRVRTAVYPERLDEVVAAGLRTGTPLAGPVEMGPLKIISDGSMNTRTAHCCEPYPGTSSRGMQNYTADELVGLLTRARSAGLTAAVHAIGDAAVSIALDAFEASGAVGSIEHAQLVRREDLPRMARLGVRASVQPAHLLDDRDVTQRWWPDRADRCFALRSMLSAGVTLALGSDAPVSPLDPWEAMAAAVHRSADAREPWNAAESLTAAEALAASVDGATTLAAGSRADLVLLDADPLAPLGDPATVAKHLREMPVAATFQAGRATYAISDA